MDLKLKQIYEQHRLEGIDTLGTYVVLKISATSIYIIYHLFKSGKY